MSYPNDNLSDDIDALISGADSLSAAASSIHSIQNGTDALVSNFDHVEAVFSNLQSLLSELKSGHFYCPVGMISPFAGIDSSVPSGWLVCDGRSYSTSGASTDLQSILNAAGFSALPNLAGKVIAGVGTILGSSRSVGASLGAETLPEHYHNIDHDHSNATTSTDGNHHHFTYLQQYNFYGSSGATAGYDKNGAQNVQSGDAGSHNHTVDIPTYYGNSGPAGTGSHGVVQPTVVLNYIIKN